MSLQLKKKKKKQSVQPLVGGSTCLDMPSSAASGVAAAVRRLETVLCVPLRCVSAPCAAASTHGGCMTAICLSTYHCDGSHRCPYTSATPTAACVPRTSWCASSAFAVVAPDITFKRRG